MRDQQQKVNVFWIPELTVQERRALKAVWQGEGTPAQQRLAMSTIIDKVSMADFLPYQPDSFSDTAFLNGRAFVGKSVRRIIKSPSEEQENNQ